jgi:hypothetical protein
MVKRAQKKAKKARRTAKKAAPQMIDVNFIAVAPKSTEKRYPNIDDPTTEIVCRMVDGVRKCRIVPKGGSWGG